MTAITHAPAQQKKPEAGSRVTPSQVGAPAVPPTPRGANLLAEVNAGGDATTASANREYTLAPGDVVELKVFGEPQFDGAYEVEANGTVSLPFIEQPVTAQCRTINAVRKDVSTSLGKFLRNPQIYMRVKELKSRQPAVVYGAVRSPAKFEMHRRARLLELLSQSGGVTDQSNGVIQITHTLPLVCPEPDEVQVAAAPTTTDALGMPFSLYKVNDLKQGKYEANPYIRPGDIVYVSEATPIYVTGSVVQPANLFLRDEMTLTRALAIVGGVRKEANTTKVRIYRQKPGNAEPEIITANFDAIRKNKEKDVLLQPYDVIEVPEAGALSKKGIGSTLLGLIKTGASAVATTGPSRILY